MAPHLSNGRGSQKAQKGRDQWRQVGKKKEGKRKQQKLWLRHLGTQSPHGAYSLNGAIGLTSGFY